MEPPVTYKMLQKSVNHFRKGDTLLERLGAMPSGKKMSRIAETLAKVMNNESEVDLNWLYRCEAEIKTKTYKTRAYTFIAKIIINTNDNNIHEAENWIKKAIELNKQNGMMSFLGRDYAIYADFFKRKGDQSKAKENLRKAIDILKECGAGGWVEKYKKELTELS